MRRAFFEAGAVFRSMGRALNDAASTLPSESPFTSSGHRPVMNLAKKQPVLSLGVFVAPTASVIGQVICRSSASVWYGAVVRGDVNKVYIGHSTNIQDRSVITAPTEDCLIGNKVTVGHGAIISSSTIENNVLVGQGAVIQDGCIVQEGSVIAAGSVLSPGTFVKKDSVFAGNPAKFLRMATAADKDMITQTCEAYTTLASQHASDPAVLTA